MPMLPFGLSAYSRANGRLPAVRLVNMFAEDAPTAQGGMVLIPRQGLNLEYDLGSDIRGLYRSDGVFSGEVYAVAGEELFRDETSIGVVEGFDPVEFAFTVDGLFILGNGTVYQTDGDAVVATEFPDNAPVASIASIDNFLVAVRQDTGTIYFRVPGDTTWNALDFFSAERQPDPAVCVRTLSDLLYVFGTATVEIFAPTGNAESPFSRVDGLSIQRGIKDRDSAVRMDNTVFFVGEDNIVYRVAGVPERVSDHGIEERIAASSSASAWTYSLSGHAFYVLRLDDETLAYDVSSGTWHQLVWPVWIGLYDGQRTYATSGGQVHTLRDRPDDNGEAFERVFTAIAATDRVGTCHAIEVHLSPGTTPYLDEPAQILMRWSDDQSRTWTDWKEANTGLSGQYRHRVRYRRLGMVDPPGRVFELKQTDPVQMRFSGVEMNPYIGGRSRG